MSALEGARPRTEGVGVQQKTATLPQQIFAFRCQAEAPTDTIEKPHAEVGLQGENLARCRRLAEVQATARAGDATGVGDAHEGAQMAEIHPALFQILHETSKHKCIGHIKGARLSLLGSQPDASD